MVKQNDMQQIDQANDILILDFTLNLNKYYQNVIEQQSFAQIDDQCTADEKGYMSLYIDQQIRQYRAISALGQGSFGRVVKVQTGNGYQAAMKISRNQKYFVQSLKQEMEIYEILNKTYPGLTCDFIEAFQYGDFYCGVIELYDINLYKYYQQQGKLNCQEMKLVCKIFAKWLIALKQQGIIHTDLKPENCLIKGNDLTTLKLIDFGSCVLKGQTQPSYIQSRYYRAPEITFKRYETYTHAIDQWSVFTLLVELATGYTLFPAKTSTMLVKMYTSLLGIPDKSILIDDQGEFRIQCKKYFIPNNSVYGYADEQYIKSHLNQFYQYNFTEEDQFLLNEETLTSEDKPQCYKRSLEEIIYTKVDESWTTKDLNNFIYLIKHGLVYDPEKRWTGEDILQSDFLNSK